MSWQEHGKLTERLATVRQRLQGLFPHWRLGVSYSGFSEALAAHGPDLAASVIAHLRRRMQQVAGPRQRINGWLPLAADGSRIECPRTAANEQALGCAGKMRTAPQVALTSLYHLTLGLPWDFRAGPGTDSERTHLRDMLGELPPETLLVADAGFAGYELCRRIAEESLSFLFRVGSNIRLLTALGGGYEIRGETVYLWPNRQQQRREPPLALRLIVLGRGERQVYLVTNVLDAERLSAEQAESFYRQRWGVEVFYRSFKQTMQHKTLDSRTPINCVQELVWAVIGLWLMGLLALPSLIAAGHAPRHWSPAATRDCLRRRLRHDHRRRGPTLSEQLAAAVKDAYSRRRPKPARDWPHQKREPPPKPPQIKQATHQQRQRAQPLLANSPPN